MKVNSRHKKYVWKKYIFSKILWSLIRCISFLKYYIQCMHYCISYHRFFWQFQIPTQVWCNFFLQKKLVQICKLWNFFFVFLLCKVFFCSKIWQLLQSETLWKIEPSPWSNATLNFGRLLKIALLNSIFSIQQSLRNSWKNQYEKLNWISYILEWIERLLYFKEQSID